MYANLLKGYFIGLNENTAGRLCWSLDICLTLAPELIIYFYLVIPCKQSFETILMKLYTVVIWPEDVHEGR